MNKIFFLILAFYICIPVVFLSGRQVNAQGNQDYAPGQILVKFHDNISEGELDKEAKRNNAKVSGKIEALGVLILQVPQSQEERIVAALSRNPNVEYAELDYLAFVSDFPAGPPNDPNYADKQWGLENTGQTILGNTGIVDADIDAQSAWFTTVSSSSASVKIGVLDTGIDSLHPDLAGQIDLQKNFSDSPTADDLYGHGTHVGGIIAATANNGIGVIGVCPTCKLMNVKVLNDKGAGAYSWVANGIIWATDNGAKVINMSLGGSGKSTTLEKAVNYAWSKNVVVVAAAGNSGNPAKTYPGAYTNVMAVAATNNLDKKATFSSYGSWVDIAAPGEDIYSTLPTHAFTLQNYGKSLDYDFLSGTSMSTPMVSGVAGLVWGTAYGTSSASVRTRLQSTADKIAGSGTYWSSGRVNAANAVAP